LTKKKQASPYKKEDKVTGQSLIPVITANKSKLETGQELYDQTKLPYHIYLEAALVAANKQRFTPHHTLEEYRGMVIEKAVKDLGFQ
jgi:hypothetical protein